ncbi:MAG: hypothetical protein ABIM20_05865 [candidate division WOR-3 bacterium]
MPRKRKESTGEINLSPEVLNTLLSSLVTNQFNQLKLQQKKGRKRKREPRIGFNLLIPHKLYAQLRNYVDFYADKGESITSIILAGLEKELKERFQRKMMQKEMGFK